MLIGIDVGNTNITVGLFEGGVGVRAPLLSWRFNTIGNATADELAAPLIAHFSMHNIDPKRIDAAIVSSVVPELYYSLRRMFRTVFHIESPIFINEKTDSGMGFDYPNPAEVGADRIVNGAAALELYGGPLIIIDFGTATTFCCISEQGEYLGGQILPGIGISLHALVARAAKLSGVRITKPESVIGKSTAQGMANGIFYQTVGAVGAIVSLLAAEMSGTPKVLATGGFATLFRDAVDCIDIIDQELTLKGLKIIYDRLAQ